MSTSIFRDILTSYIVNVELLSALLFIQPGLNNLCCVWKESKVHQLVRALSNKAVIHRYLCHTPAGYILNGTSRQTPFRLLQLGYIFVFLAKTLTVIPPEKTWCFVYWAIILFGSNIMRLTTRFTRWYINLRIGSPVVGSVIVLPLMPNFLERPTKHL